MAVWLGTYFSPLDMLLTLLFFLVIAVETRSQVAVGAKPVRTAMVWQAPGLVLSIAILSGWWQYVGAGQYFIFLLEFWSTPVLPLISILAQPFLPYPSYYYMLLSTPFFLSLFYLILTALVFTRNKP
ncbi:MAG: hypothetical protein ACOX6I_08630 [Syntrophomonadaceae bacterium]